jgi:hypothetical protein
MATYKFDGSSLKIGSKTIANVKNSKIYEGTSTAKCLANFKSDKIYLGSSTAKCIANVHSEKVYEGSSTAKKISTLKEIKREIDGIGGITLAALWLVCVR